MIDKLELIYSILEINYLEKHGYKPDDLEESILNIYPMRWFETKDYKNKIKLLAEAINENKLIEETDYYKELSKDILL